MSSHQCVSCGQVFCHASFEADESCGRCLQPDSDHPQCTGCSKLFPRLNGVECGMCSQQTVQSTNSVGRSPLHQPITEVAREAISQPFNPRGGSVPSSQRFSAGQFAAASTLSQNIVNRMHSAYQNAVTIHAQKGGDPPAPTGLPLTTTLLAPNIFVKIPMLFLITGTASRKQPAFTPFHGTFAGDLQYSDLKEAVRVWVDGHCSKKVDPPFRVYATEDIELRFQHSNLPPIPETELGNISTLYAVHKAKKDNYMSEKGPKDMLIFTIHVAMPITSTAENLSEFRSVGVKRRASTEFASRFRSRAAGSGSRPPTRSSVDLVTFKKLFSTALEEVPHEDEESEDVNPKYKEITSNAASEYRFFDYVEIGRGATKKAIKIQSMEGKLQFYAAKLYVKKDTSATVTAVENIALLREEMTRANVAAQYAASFTQEAKDKRVSIHALDFLQPSILHENKDLDDGPAWICDKYILGTAQKYSGTGLAGSHDQSFVGQTCDTLAHYSLDSSAGKQLLVDLQGIIATSAQRGGLPVLHMYDVQIHTEDEDEDSGLGDMGAEGIELFRAQHKCNAICKALSLPALTQDRDC